MDNINKILFSARHWQPQRQALLDGGLSLDGALSQKRQNRLRVLFQGWSVIAL